MKKYVFFMISIMNGVIAIPQVSDSIATKNNLMNSNIEMVEMFEYNVFDTLLICNNKEAIRIFENNLNTLKSYINQEKENSLKEVIRIILNFELLTTIESESDGNFFGKYNPTKRDIENWELWFEDHKNSICWCEEKNILFLRKY